MNFNIVIIFFEILSSFIMLVSYILIIIQSFENFNFKNYKTNKSIVERLLYEQFSYEIYSNLNSSIFLKENKFNTENEDMPLEIKSNTYYDCRGINDDELNEKICQNKIINNYTCCKPECCFRTNGNNIYCNDYVFSLNDNILGHNKILFYNDDELLEDPKRRFCTYYNEYRGNMNQKDLTFIDLYRFKYNYIDIFYSNKTSLVCIGKTICKSGYYDCGIIDTKNNHLYAKEISYCPINRIYKRDGDDNFYIWNIHDNYYNYFNDNYYNYYNQYYKIIVRNILSEIPPNIHEWKYNYINIETMIKFNSINLKEINKVINNINYDNYYQKQDVSININSVINSFGDTDKINYKEKLNWYTTNYIGFEDLKNFEKFYNICDIKNPKNNSLYKFGDKIYPSLESIIIGSILLFFCLIFIIIYLIFIFKNYENFQKVLTWVFSIKTIIIISTFVTYLVIYTLKTKEFPKISIEIDDNYKQILDLYNKRRSQLCLLSGIIIMAFAGVFTIIGVIISKIKFKNYANININEDNNNNQERTIPYEPLGNNNISNMINNNNNNNNDNNNDNNNNIDSINNIINNNNSHHLNLNRQSYGDNQNNNEDKKSSERNLVTNSKEREIKTSYNSNNNILINEPLSKLK